LFAVSRNNPTRHCQHNSRLPCPLEPIADQKTRRKPLALDLRCTHKSEKPLHQRFTVRYAGVTKLNCCNHGDAYDWLRLRNCYFGEFTWTCVYTVCQIGYDGIVALVPINTQVIASTRCDRPKPKT
jgi:hypothetical protein